ncbi:tetr bacterial regulatory protein hth signature [Lucifera butyrica]|uniref:Tetr bacterial regulatory protein hth signature n=1 Tax=Lucifera butyrica TaxID=1351585 RepID=A0A498RDW5_9FIRM|nr:TetR/AcrR family transcriptional regulator [Lucifera butyrica]VBB09519.1 tetr bacterial regulatory protein hth signature [Lucifera butyrica]
MTDKRREIVAAAAALMHSKGYENTKLADILEAAQIGKGQFYHYFSSKHELGLAVLNYRFESWNQRLMENILSSGKDPETKINEMLDWVIEQQRLNQAKCGCVFGNLAVEMSEHDEAFRRKLETVFEIWVSKLKPVLSEMILPVQADPEEINKMAQGIVAMIEGGILLMKSKQDLNVLVNITAQIKFLIRSFVQNQRH